MSGFRETILHFFCVSPVFPDSFAPQPIASKPLMPLETLQKKSAKNTPVGFLDFAGSSKLAS
jgi:hypothetical protein